MRMYNKRKGSSLQSPIKRLKTLERQVAVNKGELKYSTFTINNEQLSSVYNLDITTAIQQGVGKNQRIGDKIRVAKVEIRSEGVNASDRLRMTLYSPNNTGTTIPTAQNGSFHRFVETDKFRVWDDRTNMDALSAISGTPAEDARSGKQVMVKKVWANPMIVIYDVNNNLVKNEITLNTFKEGGQGVQFAATDNTLLRYEGKIWYYDH